MSLGAETSSLLIEADPSDVIHLDDCAVKSLELFANGQLKANKSLFHLLNKCRTAPGKLRLEQWLRQPLMNIDLINERLNLVAFFVDNSEIRQEMYENYLRKVPDLAKLSKKLEKKTATLQDCYSLYLVINILPDIEACLLSSSPDVESTVQLHIIDKLKKLSDQLSQFKKIIKKSIDFDRVELKREFWVNSNYNETLKQIKADLDEMEKEATGIFKKVAKEVGLEVDKLIKMETNAQGFILRVTLKNEREIRCLKNIEVDKTKKDGVRFVNPSLKNLNKQYAETRKEYEAKQKDIIEEIIDLAAGYACPISDLANVLALLDVTVALAIVSVSSFLPYTRPKLLAKGSGKIYLKQVRHPCVEQEETISFIPNDCNLDNEKFKSYIITGPNMGGKSTFIKSVAICVLLAQVGSFVPAEAAEISLVDGIFTRVGAGDNQVEGVSTFMAEMTETSKIIKAATANSLVIIDELGRGTSTFDGFGLAWAIAETIVKEIRAFTLFATHFDELTDLSKHVPSIGNLNLKAITTNDKLTMLYQVFEGVCEKSFGIEVAKMVKFPQHIIEDADQKLKDLEGYTERNIDWNNEGFINELISDILAQPNITIENVRETILAKLRDEESLMVE